MTASRSVRLPHGSLYTVVVLAGIAVCGSYLVMLAWGLQYSAYNLSGGLIVAPMLTAVTIPILARAARRDQEPMMFWILVAAFGLKLIGTLVRYAVSFELYGKSDARAYDAIGRTIASAIWDGNLIPAIGEGGPGTRFIQKTVGWVYVLVGPTRLGGFFVFSWLGFLGMFLFYRAFRLAFPHGDHRRYVLLLFFLPSLLFWPSSIGKEAWMTLTLGVTAYGMARLLNRMSGGLLILALGLWATMVVRPHVALVVLVSLTAALLFRRSAEGPGGRGGKVVLLVAMLGVGLVLVSRVEQFFGIDGVDPQSAEAVFNETERRSTQGDSAFESARVRSPLDFPGAVFAVLFRPWPWEVHNAQSLVAALEGTALLAICIRSYRRFGGLPQEMGRTPWVTLAMTFTVLFVVAFSSVGNFGIIARQRVQVFPFLLVLLSLPRRVRAENEATVAA